VLFTLSVKCANFVCLTKLKEIDELRIKRSKKFMYCFSCRNSGHGVVGECKNCKETFTMFILNNKEFCSNSCRSKFKYIRLYKKRNFCQLCGKHVKSKYCSKECYSLLKQIEGAGRKLRELLLMKQDIINMVNGKVDEKILKRRIKNRKQYWKTKEATRKRKHLNYLKNKDMIIARVMERYNKNKEILVVAK